MDARAQVLESSAIIPGTLPGAGLEDEQPELNKPGYMSVDATGCGLACCGPNFDCFLSSEPCIIYMLILVKFRWSVKLG